MSSSNDLVARLLFRLSPFLRVTIVLSGAVLVHLTLGTYHTFGNMLPYMASYLRNYTDHNVRIEHMMWIPMLQGAFPFAMVIGGALSLKLGSRTAAVIGCSICTLGVYLSSLSIKHSLPAFTFTYGLLFGIGEGISYVVAVTCVINWAPDRVGLVSGIVAAGFGLSSSIFAPIQTALVNPWNHPATKEGYFVQPELLERVPQVFLTLSTVYLIMQCIGVIVICDPPETLTSSGLGEYGRWRGKSPRYPGVAYSAVSTTEDVEPLILESTRRRNQSASSDEPVLSSDEDDDLKHPQSPSLTPGEMMRSSTFYFLFAALFCCSFYANMFYNLYKTYAETFISDDFFLALCFSIGSVANAIARIGWGYLSDKTSFQLTIAIACCSASGLLLSMPLTQHLGQTAYLIWLILLFICMAATHALFITAAVKCFGPKYKGPNYGLLIFSTSCSGTILSIASEYWLPLIGYNWAFIITAAFPFTAFVLTSTIQYTKHGHYIC
ncbi:unnamed protein product, partial [Mesorhabditis spiculigera]